jgi:hypothetical protein
MADPKISEGGKMYAGVIVIRVTCISISGRSTATGRWFSKMLDFGK